MQLHMLFPALHMHYVQRCKGVPHIATIPCTWQPKCHEVFFHHTLQPTSCSGLQDKLKTFVQNYVLADAPDSGAAAAARDAAEVAA